MSESEKPRDSVRKCCLTRFRQLSLLCEIYPCLVHVCDPECQECHCSRSDKRCKSDGFRPARAGVGPECPESDVKVCKSGDSEVFLVLSAKSRFPRRFMGLLVQKRARKWSRSGFRTSTNSETGVLARLPRESTSSVIKGAFHPCLSNLSSVLPASSRSSRTRTSEEP